VVNEIKSWESDQKEGGDFWTAKAVLVSSLLKFALPAHAGARAVLAGGGSGGSGSSSSDGDRRKTYLFRFDVHSPLLDGKETTTTTTTTTGAAAGIINLPLLLLLPVPLTLPPPPPPSPSISCRCRPCH